MSEPDEEPDAGPAKGLADAIRKRSERRKRWLREGGEPPVLHFVGQIGVLGWMIVTPGLLFLFFGRWLDHRFGTGVFWSAPLLMLGLALGFWSAWRWMNRQ
ncbi:AtpZ/AtpI family protein [Phenylobacterium sp.]|uniref:AtpZ/AtpI family protein n=1 Tax=Phenylobacterium sp. TaxID=1871053 RepID=UPI0035B288F3